MGSGSGGWVVGRVCTPKCLRMVVEQIACTDANPLAAPFACHELYGVSDPAPGRAVELLASRPLTRVFLVTSGLLTVSVAEEVRELFASAEADVAFAHYNWQWFVAAGETPVYGLTLVWVAFGEHVDVDDALDVFSVELPSVSVYSDNVLFPAGAVADLRLKLTEAVEARACAPLRQVAAHPVFDPDEVCACDPPETIFGLVADILEALVSEQEASSALLGFCSRLLSFIGNRSSDRLALLVSNVCRSDMSPADKLAALDDFRSGRL